MVSDAEFKINRAKIKLQSRNPFFAYLSLYMTTQEAKEGELPPYALGGVSPRGIMTYNPEKIKELEDEQVITFLTHEILHLSLLHLTRRGSREPTKWNFATDLVINTILKQNGFKDIEGSIISNYDDEFECRFAKGGKIIKEVSKKNAEMIYDEMPDVPNWLKNLMNSSLGEGEGNSKGKTFSDAGFTPKDAHLEEKGGEGERTKSEEEWLKRLEEASQVAKSKGMIPNGMERYIDSLKKGKINWKALLQRYLQSMLPHDYSWCLDENTKISTLKGEIPIKRVRQGRYILGYKNGKIVRNKVKSKWKSLVKEKYIIITKSGKKVICSPNHRFLTDKGYVKAKYLTKNQKIMTIK